LIALDTNVLVYARRRESAHHAAAKKLLTGLAEGDEPWALPWPCVYEFLRVITHPRVFDPPTRLDAALDGVKSLLASPSLVLLGEGSGHTAHMIRAVESGAARGNLAHDAHIAALALEHGVQELWTTDRDFARFPGLVIRNPFEEPAVHDRRGRYRAKSRRHTAPARRNPR
jgi:toxin-antitoxin system PIN domain toxin